jgi:RNA polymerase sigma-70 factor (ECF subfamily)
MNPAAETQPTPTDSTLMERVRAGDLEQLSELFERHHRRLYQFFLKLARDRSAAEDLVQEVFVRVLKYRHTWRNEAEFVPWMFALARNAAVDQFRSRARDSKRDAAAVPDTTPQPALVVDRLEERERASQLRAALELLAPDKREVLLLARFGELKHDRIAAMLGITPGAVRVRLHRALKELREAYRQVSAEQGAE